MLEDSFYDKLKKRYHLFRSPGALDVGQAWSHEIFYCVAQGITLHIQVSVLTFSKTFEDYMFFCEHYNILSTDRNCLSLLISHGK